MVIMSDILTWCGSIGEEWTGVVASSRNLYEGRGVREDVWRVASVVCKILGVLSLVLCVISTLWLLLTAVWKIATIFTSFIVGHDVLACGENMCPRNASASLWDGTILKRVFLSFYPSEEAGTG